MRYQKGGNASAFISCRPRKARLLLDIDYGTDGSLRPWRLLRLASRFNGIAAYASPKLVAGELRLARRFA